MTAGAAAATAGMELNDFLALDPHTREFLRKTLNEDAKALMAELGNDPKAKGKGGEGINAGAWEKLKNHVLTDF